jgi:hypothetical protein
MHRAYCFQEMIKGGPLPAILWGVDSHGGWGFNVAWVNEDPQIVNNFSDADLRASSIFKPFYDLNIYGPNGSAIVSNPVVRAKLLAEAIPAISRATGRNAVPLLFDDNNVDMMLFKAQGMTWPRNDNNWKHGDYCGVAYLFNFGLYNDIVFRGSLQ